MDIEILRYEHMNVSKHESITGRNPYSCYKAETLLVWVTVCICLQRAGQRDGLGVAMTNESNQTCPCSGSDGLVVKRTKSL